MSRKRLDANKVDRSASNQGSSAGKSLTATSRTTRPLRESSMSQGSRRAQSAKGGSNSAQTSGECDKSSVPSRLMMYRAGGSSSARDSSLQQQTASSTLTPDSVIGLSQTGELPKQGAAPLAAWSPRKRSVHVSEHIPVPPPPRPAYSSNRHWRRRRVPDARPP